VTIRSRHRSRCAYCETEVDVSDVEKPYPHEAEGRFFMVHAPFSVRCPGSGVRVEVYWLAGEAPGKFPEEGMIL
jgi:hypothetical protein